MFTSAECIIFPHQSSSCPCLFVDGCLEAGLLLQVGIRITTPTMMHIVLLMTLRRSRPFQTAQRTTGALALTWGREGHILTLPSCIQAQAGTLLAMRSPPMVTQNRCFSHQCLLGIQVGEDCCSQFCSEIFDTPGSSLSRLTLESHPASPECVLEINDQSMKLTIHLRVDKV